MFTVYVFSPNIALFLIEIAFSEIKRKSYRDCAQAHNHLCAPVYARALVLQLNQNHLWPTLVCVLLSLLRVRAYTYTAGQL